jgi:dipeptidyl aminopeptidase/acylaminoacyl peptidase
MQPDPVFAHFTKARTTVIDATTGAASPLAVEAPNGGPQISHDGRSVAIALPRHKTVYLQSDVSIRALADGHEIRSGAAIDRNVHWFAWTPKDDALLVATADGVRDVLWRLPVSGGAPQQVDLGELDFTPGSIADDGTLAFVGTRTDALGELYVLAPNATQPRRLTSENAFLADYALAKRERFDWTSDDGTKIDGVLTYPVNYQAGKQYPLVLDIHGGPVSTSTAALLGIEAPLDELLATDGYFVLQPNYRGSDNEGDAFLSAIVPHVTSGPGRDNLAGVEALKKTGMIDPARIGVSGWSGGGLQTSWLVGHANYWRAAVTGAGVHDWYEQAVLADINEEFARVFLGGATPWTKEGRAIFRAESPITYVDQIRTPLLILSDTGDQRVPITQSYALYRALHDRGKTVKFIAYPRAGHFPTDPVGRESVLRQWAGWFERWMK